MDDINILEELGLQEVSRKTHIETKFLQYMVEKQFDKLNKINTLGFVKILKREYNINLDSWVEEFEQYCKENEKFNISEPKSVLLTRESMDSPKSKKGWFFLIFIIILAVVVYYAINLGLVDKIRQTIWQNSENNTTFAKAQVVQDTKEQLLQLQNETNNTQETQDDVSVQNNEIVNEVEAENNILNEQDQTQITQEDENSKEVENEQNIQNENEQNQINEQMPTNTQQNEVENQVEKEVQAEKEVQNEEKIEDSATLKPRRNIWVGIVDLDTKKRTQFLSKKSIKISLNKPQIIITGHGDFLLKVGDKDIKTDSSKTPKYYYADGGTITSISKKEFNAYNGGKPW